MDKPRRTYFAAGEYMTRFPPGSSEEILIDSPRQKRNWHAHAPGNQLRPEFPGTAVVIDGRYYEVLRIALQPGEPPRHLYFLGAWPDHFPIRAQFSYTREECERAAAEQKREQAEDVAGTLLAVLSPLAGLLPAEDQRRLENTYGISALKCTLYSAFLMLALGALALLLCLVATIAPESLRGWGFIGNIPPLALALFGIVILGESILRLINTRHDEPMGSIPVAVPIEAVRAVRRALNPSEQRRRFERMEAGGESAFLNARDEVREINETDIEILSILPKPNWNPMTGILLNETWYGCIESGTVAKGKNVCHRFVLRKAPEGMTFRTTCKYHPDEVRDRYREKRRTDLGTWVETFAPFWGLLEGQDQRRLEQIYGFKPLKYTAWTIAVLMLIGAANVAVSAINMFSGVAAPGDVVWFCCAGYLLIESIVRLRKWLKNEPSGSVLSVLLRPIASRLLDV